MEVSLLICPFYSSLPPRFEWRIILNQTFLLCQAKTQILSLVNWKEDISMIYSRNMVEQRTLKTQEMFKYSCCIRASTMRSCNYYKHREGFHLSGVYHPKISRGEMHNKLWLLHTNHSPVYTIKPSTGNNFADLPFNNTKTNCNAIVVFF